jgi:hypothetical protein
MIDKPATGIFVRQSTEHAHEMIERNFVGARIGAHLLSRSWVYQEITLSPRTVHFHRDEFVWECRSNVSCECGYFDWLAPVTQKNGDSWRKEGWKTPYSTLISMSNSNTLDQRAILKQWHSMIIAYSGLHLTFETDRLPALAGMASKVAELLQARYFAGIWECCIWEGLLWERSRSQVCRRLAGPAISVPSWSWASITSAQEWNVAPTICSIGEGFFPPRPHSTKVCQPDDQFKLIDARCSGSASNPFGNVTTGIMNICGVLKPAILMGEYGHRTLQPWYHIQFEDEVGDRALPSQRNEPTFDVWSTTMAGEVSSGDLLYCLLVGNSQRWRSDMKNDRRVRVSVRHLLVLKNVGVNFYTRVGTLDHDKEDDGISWNQAGTTIYLI